MEVNIVTCLMTVYSLVDWHQLLRRTHFLRLEGRSESSSNWGSWHLLVYEAWGRTVCRGREGANIKCHNVCYEATRRGTRKFEAKVGVLFLLFHPRLRLPTPAIPDPFSPSFLYNRQNSQLIHLVLKMEAVSLLGKLIPTYHTIWCHNQDDSAVSFIWHVNLSYVL